MLIGGGGHCISVLDCILSSREYDEIVIVDSNVQVNSKILGCPVVGDDRVLPELKKSGFDYAFITVGAIKSTKTRRKLYELARSLDFEFPVISDPSAVVSKNSNIGAGTFIGKDAVINAKASIGVQCIVNTGAIIEHECTVGSFSHISVGAILCGNCVIGSDSFIGAGSTLIQGITTGNKVIIGAGSTVLCNIDDNVTVSGLVKDRRQK